MPQHSQNYDSTTLQKTRWRKSIQAFAVVSLASFLLMSLFWPMNVSGFVNRSSIDIDVVKTPQAVSTFKQQLQTVVARNTSPEAVSQLVRAVQQTMTGETLNKLASEPDFSSRINVNLQKAHEEGIFRLAISYSGQGTHAESYMLNLLTTNIARDFLASPGAAIGTGTIKVPAGSTSQDLIAQSAELTAKAYSMIDNLEATRNESSGMETSSTPFLNVSHRQTTSDASADTVGELRQAVGQLSTLVQDANQQAVSTGGVAYSIREVKGKSMTPIGAVPQGPQILMLAVVAGMLGTIVTVAYRPFDERGFESLDSLTSKLGVPVLATIPKQHSGGAHPADNLETKPLANQLVGYAELTLFAITIVVIGFCILNPPIRQAFAENLYHGFARIFWIFRG